MDVVTPSSIQDLLRLLSEVLWQCHTDVPKVLLLHNLSIQAPKLWKTLLEDHRKAAFRTLHNTLEHVPASFGPKEVYTVVKSPAHPRAKYKNKQPFVLTCTLKAINKFTSTPNEYVWTMVGSDEDEENR